MKFVLVCYSRNRKQTQATSSMKPSLITPGPHPSSLPPCGVPNPPVAGTGPSQHTHSFMSVLAPELRNCILFKFREYAFCFFVFTFLSHPIQLSRGLVTKQAFQRVSTQCHLSYQSAILSSWATKEKFTSWCHRLAIHSSGVLIQRVINVTGDTFTQICC